MNWLTHKQQKDHNLKAYTLIKKIETNSLQIASEFNSFFNKIVAKTDEKIISTYSTFRIKEKQMIIPCSSCHPLQMEFKLQDKKATGPNKIPSKMLKNL